MPCDTSPIRQAAEQPSGSLPKGRGLGYLWPASGKRALNSDGKPSSRSLPPRVVLARAARWILLLPFLVFATFSQGTMLDAAVDGGLRIVLCTGDGEVEAMMAPDGSLRPVDAADRDDHSGDLVCDWALHAQPALDTEPVAVDPPLILELRSRYAIDVPLHLRRADVLTPAARGPPSFV